ncbi:OLC1v1035862C1 [Oldenlandia corymbosa var. corymbosa]|uniref:OLC1v1035862C1 n=1 Tax=Oldenlandia corymbosa var. corymbosa TaxID=529605 RepID=A0AAV1CUN4_OLDCO|nr:OLC1v1035862C1 [Oldenlandia corymbosa var. corymbosa]
MAKSTEKLQDCSKDESITVDRISDLHDSLLCYILCFLPTKFAVATSVLSRRWKSIWTMVTTLNFDYSNFNVEKTTKISKFVDFVNNVLLHLDVGRLESFHLNWWEEECQGVYVNSWVSNAIMRNVRFLDLHVCTYDNVAQVPASLFTCGSLEHVELEGYIVVKVPSVVSLPLLKSLILYSVTYETDLDVPRLISGCPVLHVLMMQRHPKDNVQVYKISSASLKHLTVYDFDYSEAVDDAKRKKLEIDPPAIESLEIWDDMKELFVKTRLNSVKDVKLYLDFDAERINSIVKAFQALEHTKFLKLEGTVMEALNHVPTISLSVKFSNLTQLDIECHCCHWRALLVMLGDPVQVPECLSSSLAKISITGLKGLKDEISLIKYLLKHGSGMRRIKLHSAPDHCALKDKFQMQREISLLCAISATSHVHFDGNHIF